MVGGDDQPGRDAGVLTLGQLYACFAGIAFTITAISLVQTLTPERLLGRVNATRRFLVRGAIPLGTGLAPVAALDA